LRYFRETCVGLSFLHANGVAHRDLKPDNLLKKTDGTVKITDFGVSELFDGSKKGNLTGGVGTPAFVAPELVATREAAAAAAAAYFEKDLKPILKPSRSGSKPGFETDVAARELAEAEEDAAERDGKGGGGVDAKACDVWSLGVCLFYQVCGVVPFPGASAGEVARRVREDPLRVRRVVRTFHPSIGCNCQPLIASRFN
jgi:[calcium/calmodulin-dependent protein kinase] kinase